MNITLCKASNGYSIALVDEGAAGDAEWERVRAAGEPWPLLFRALWVHEKHATTALDVVRKKFSETESMAELPDTEACQRARRVELATGLTFSKTIFAKIALCIKGVKVTDGGVDRIIAMEPWNRRWWQQMGLDPNAEAEPPK